MGSFLSTLWIVISLLVGYNLVLPIILFVCYKLRRKHSFSSAVAAERDFAVIVTAYEQTNTLNQAVASLLRLKYKRFLIYVVADNCDVSNLRYEDDRVILLRPESVLKSNTRSHLYAMERFKRAHECVTIIDSDNVVEANYLTALNKCFEQGYKAVQGVRKAKNLDTVYACVDAIQDIYYHFYDREILYALGSSATLAGSGMAFESDLYRSYLQRNDVKGAGFDKVLQIDIVQSGKRIAFTKHAIVYDEKTSKPDQLVKQRARWFNTWFQYAGLGFGLLSKSLRRLDWNAFLFALMFVRPPLFLLVVSGFVLMVANLFFSPILFFFWITAFFLFVMALILALVHVRAEKKIYQALGGIPLFVFYQLLSLLKVKKANQISVATQHYHSKSVEDVEK
jgi:cellulose synthase/poly-beta-1,6-N-acetylglucosamine synthase-like glycosyltransferase